MGFFSGITQSLGGIIPGLGGGGGGGGSSSTDVSGGSGFSGGSGTGSGSTSGFGTKSSTSLSSTETSNETQYYNQDRRVVADGGASVINAESGAVLNLSDSGSAGAMIQALGAMESFGGNSLSAMNNMGLSAMGAMSESDRRAMGLIADSGRNAMDVIGQLAAISIGANETLVDQLAIMSRPEAVAADGGLSEKNKKLLIGGAVALAIFMMLRK